MKIREFSRDRTTASWMGREAMYLIEPAALEAPDAMLAAWRAIVSNDRAAAAPVLGPQRYLVKQPGPASHGFRAVYEERLRHRWRTLGSKHEVFAVSTGTNALRVALRGVRAMADRPGLEVLVPATTVANTIEAVMMEGLVPVLVDIDPHTWLVDLDAAADAVGERTLALVSVDWLGTGVDVDAVGAFCRRHDIAWISDSAQSFGIEHGGRPPVTHADVTTFSTGYPKIFHTGGRGGLVVARREIVERLVVDAHGVLRNEPLPELNAIAGLDLLRDFDDILSHRRAIGDLYAELLAPLPGFYPQVIASAERTNRYQISVRVDPHQSGLRPEQIVGHLASLGVEANAGRMPCLALDDRLAAGTVKAAGELPVSRRLAGASITLPMPQNLRREQCEWICRRVRDLQHQRSGPRLAVDVTPSEPSVARVLLRATTSTRFWSIEEKALAYVSAAGERWLAEHVLVPPDALIEAAVSVPEILSALDAMATVDEGDRVGESDLRVLGILPEGDLMLDRSFDEPSQTTDEIDLGSLIESGSSASVGLALTGDGRLRVNKRCATDGIDGNGRPWLRRQFHYLGANGIRDAADLFLLPDRFDQRGGEVVVSMPYADSQSLVESILGGVGADDVLRCLGEMLDPLALQVWQRGVVDATPTYVQQAHADRMRRRLAIARQAHRELHATMQQPWVELNGRALEGFTTLLPKVLEALDLDAVRPRRLTFIHGDLNLYNLLVLESGHGNDRYKMIDPRGTPLWDPDDRDEEVERGDFVYDLAKLKFSFGGFVMIRSRLYDFTRHDEASFELRAKQDHPAITTL
ncbi:MAG: DegT/DnrJ/EryC1/StrS family aminotransferase, partial [Acidobacteriota bacterium]